MVKDHRGKQTDDPALNESLELISKQLQEAEGLGALWGRRAAVLAELGMYQLEHQYPELCDTVNEQLRQP